MQVFTKALVTPNESLLLRFTAPSMEHQKTELSGLFEKEFGEQREKLSGAGLWEDMEEPEHAFMNASIFETTMRQRTDASWLAESIMCLLWALGYREQIPSYDQEVDPRSNKVEDADRLRNAELRPRAEIERQRDWAELWHWRCRTHMLLTTKKIPDALPDGTTMAEIIWMTAEKASNEGVLTMPIRDDFPAFGKAFREVSDEELSIVTSISMERHKALNWLCGYAPENRWSETPTDT